MLMRRSIGWILFSTRVDRTMGRWLLVVELFHVACDDHDVECTSRDTNHLGAGEESVSAVLRFWFDVHSYNASSGGYDIMLVDGGYSMHVVIVFVLSRDCLMVRGERHPSLEKCTRLLHRT